MGEFEMDLLNRRHHLWRRERLIHCFAREEAGRREKNMAFHMNGTAHKHIYIF